MSSISFYDSTGRITGQSDFPPSIEQMIKELTPDPWVDGAWFGKPVYVLSGEVTPRPVNPVTLSGFTLNNVPVPATVKINDTSYETNESQVELGFNLPGTYKVLVSAWPYLDKEFQIENPA